MMPYHKLNVYQKSYRLALEIHKLTLNFPKIEQHELGSQLRRASRSIVANLVEGMGRQDSAKEVQRFVRMSIGSCDESRFWLEFAKDLGYLKETEQLALEARFNEIGKMLQGIIQRYKNMA
jgi:four helix bundle protein